MTVPEPIAIVGIACRFPGASSRASLWRLLVEARDAITRRPAGRSEGWEGAPPYGGFLDDIWRFDAAFFGIAPRDAEALDPQQRLLLETTWEAIEDAGIAPRSLAGSGTGVFVGLASSDHAGRVAPSEMRGHLGSLRSGAAGRIAHSLDLLGPAGVIDTDRSSGLVAVVNACASLRAGDCDLAVVGAANVVLDAATSLAFAGQDMLAPDGRCKFADARADGFVRSDGVATLVLMPLSRARAEGRPIHALVLGGATLASGRRAPDLMGQAREVQERLVRTAHARAHVTPDDVVYVEAHGTGTPHGDHVELSALERVFCTQSRAAPLWIGSIKTNIGHTEACAGLAGLIKVALAASTRNIPPSLHFRRFPAGLAADTLRVATELVAVDRPFVAGVSAFGLTGIGAHVVVAAPPDEPAYVPGVGRVLSLSAAAPERVRALAARYAEHLRTTGDALEDVCAASTAQRDALAHRVAIVPSSRAHAIAELEGLAGDPLGSAVVRAQQDHEVVFVFPGHGPQWPGMGRQLYRDAPAFARTIDACDDVVRRLADFSIRDELESGARLDDAGVLQPLLLSMAVSLAALWRAWGIEPTAVIGASIGEVAAAHVAGVLSLEDAFRVTVCRSRLMRTLPPGSVAFVEAPAAEVAKRIDERAISIAGIQSPTSTLVSGRRDAVEKAVAAFEAAGIFARMVRIGVASHSPMVDPILPALEAELQHIAPQAAKIPMFSTVDRRIVAGPELDARYWVRNLRMPVSFAAAVDGLGSATVFVEVSPHPVLHASLLDCLASARREPRVLHTCKRDRPELTTAMEALARLHAFGVPVPWERILPVSRPVRLPTYTFAETSYPPGGATQTPVEIRDEAARLRAVTGAARVRLLGERLRHTFARVLEIDPHVVDPARPVREQGLTSIGATELRVTVGAWLGRPLSSTLMFEHPTLDALAVFLAGELDRAARVEPIASRPRPPDDDPLAIVGMAFRFPGASSVDALWAMLAEGRDAIVEIPKDRWDADRHYDPSVQTKGRMHTKWGGFVDGIGAFDPAFFGISPREAESMDPQQRLLLELTWEALEAAGTSRSRMRGTETGVFVGMMNNNEYARRKAIDTAPENVAAHTGVGDAMSIASGRLSYFFGWHGPAVTIDTACSSSLVALHLAGEAIRSGSCEAAVVAGVNVIAHPSTTLAFAKTRMLSPTGKCRTFDAAADGYVRAEGGCVLLVKPLSRALAEGLKVHAIVRGSAVNQDGRASSLTAPNGTAQRSLLRKAHAAARVTADEVSYVEAHGTGTALGDPIEVRAIADVFGGRGADNPLHVGGVKANLGHLEACAGLAGVAKVVVAMSRGAIPRQANLTTLNPKLELPDWLRVPTADVPWTSPAGPRIAGVSSFGFSGTNAHVVLEAPAAASSPSAVEAVEPAEEVVLPLSAATPEALRELARRYLDAAALAAPDARIAGVAAWAARREPLAVRAAIVGRTRTALREGLGALADEARAAALVGPVAHEARPIVGVAFGDEPPISRAAAARLYERQRAFRDAIDACATACGAPLEEWLFLKDEPRDRRLVAFAIQHGLSAWWQDFGVAPDFVVGRGAGELAAAVTAGILDLEAVTAYLASRHATRWKTHPPRLGFVSPLPGAAIDDAYWNGALEARGTPAASERALVEAGCTVVVEIGALDAAALARFFVRGVNVAWDRHSPADAPHDLPPYPFARRVYWTPDLTAK